MKLQSLALGDKSPLFVDCGSSSPAEQVHGAGQHRVWGLGAAGHGRLAHQAQPLALSAEALLVLHLLAQPVGAAAGQ